jgi:hypothetical protein
VGWQDREWAKLDDGETEALYGFRAGRRFSTRQVVWSVMAALVAAGAAFAFTHREHAAAAPSYVITPAPEVIYGQPVVFAGSQAACVEYTVDTSGSWICSDIDPNIRHVRVAPAAPYDGPCAHLVADQSTARWVCASARPTP